MRSSRDTVAVVVACVVAAATWLPRLQGPIDLRWDGAAYYILGTSLANGSGYRLLNEPGEIESVQYPPLLPSLVAALQLLVGTSDWVVIGVWLRKVFLLCFVLYAAAVYLLLRRHLPLLYALAVTGMTILHANTQHLSNLFFAEIPFALVTVLGLLWASEDERPRNTMLTALASIAAYALRTAGIAFWAAWVAEALLRRRLGTAALRAAIALVPIVVWNGYIASVQARPGYGTVAYEYQRALYMYPNVTYASNVLRLKEPFQPELGPASLADVGRRFVRNLVVIPVRVGEAVTSPRAYWLRDPNPPFPWSLTLFVVAIGGLVTVGGIAHLVRGQWLMPLFAGFYIALVCLTPFREQFWRYLTPLAPILGLWFVIALRLLSRLAIRRLRWKPVNVFPVVVIVAVLTLQAIAFWRLHRDSAPATYPDRMGRTAEYRLLSYPASFRDFDAALDWLRAHAAPGDVLASPHPHWAYLRTGHKAVLPPLEADPVEAQRLLDTVPVRYLIAQRNSAVVNERYVFPLVEHDPRGWRTVNLSGLTSEVSLFERVRGVSSASGPNVR